MHQAFFMKELGIVAYFLSISIFLPKLAWLIASLLPLLLPSNPLFLIMLICPLITLLYIAVLSEPCNTLPPLSQIFLWVSISFVNTCMLSMSYINYWGMFRAPLFMV
ncbi:hypothetical protein CsSME_00015474 [Camellia sinensis var. sinensis]